jgi:hypothetical protein
MPPDAGKGRPNGALNNKPPAPRARSAGTPLGPYEALTLFEGGSLAQEVSA